MTEITDQDRRTAIDVAEAIERGDYPMATMWPIMARVILATVDAPTTLSEELANITEHWEEWATDMITVALAAATDRAKQTEYDLAEARAEAGRLTAVNENLRRTGNYRQFREKFLTVQKGAESNAETPAPADVPPGEAWIVEVEGERRTALKDGDRYVSWNTVNTEGHPLGEANNSLTLVTRLVPAPRVITNPDELDRLPHNSVILSADNDAWQKSSETSLWASAWWTTSDGEPSMWASDRLCDEDHPVTVLWEPGA